MGIGCGESTPLAAQHSAGGTPQMVLVDRLWNPRHQK